MFTALGSGRYGLTRKEGLSIIRSALDITDDPIELSQRLSYEDTQRKLVYVTNATGSNDGNRNIEMTAQGFLVFVHLYVEAVRLSDGFSLKTLSARAVGRSLDRIELVHKLHIPKSLWGNVANFVEGLKKEREEANLFPS